MILFVQKFEEKFKKDVKVNSIDLDPKFKLSIAGEKWMTLVNGCNLPDEYDGVIEEVIGYEEGPALGTRYPVEEW